MLKGLPLRKRNFLSFFFLFKKVPTAIKLWGGGRGKTVKARLSLYSFLCYLDALMKAFGLEHGWLKIGYGLEVAAISLR